MTHELVKGESALPPIRDELIPPPTGVRNYFVDFIDDFESTVIGVCIYVSLSRVINRLRTWNRVAYFEATENVVAIESGSSYERSN